MAGPRSGNLHTAAANNCRITRKQPSILSEARSRLGGRSVRLATRRNPAADCKRELLQLPMAAGGMAMWHVRPVRSRHRRSPARSFGYGRERGGATSQSGSPRRRPAAEKARQGWRSRSRRPFSSAGARAASDRATAFRKHKVRPIMSCQGAENMLDQIRVLRWKGAPVGAVSAAGDTQRSVPGELRGIHPAVAGCLLHGFPFGIGEADRVGSAGFASYSSDSGPGSGVSRRVSFILSCGPIQGTSWGIEGSNGGRFPARKGPLRAYAHGIQDRRRSCERYMPRAYTRKHC